MLQLLVADDVVVVVTFRHSLLLLLVRLLIQVLQLLLKVMVLAVLVVALVLDLLYQKVKYLMFGDLELLIWMALLREQLLQKRLLPKEKTFELSILCLFIYFDFGL